MTRKRFAIGAVGAGVLTGAVAVLSLLLWGEEAGAQGAPQPITMVDFGFDAAETKVPLGTAVVFNNTGERPHTATDRGGTFDTQPIEPGQSAEVNLTVPGTYSYFCRINPVKMNGTVTVEAPNPAAAKVVRVQALDDANIQGETLRFDPKELQVQAGTTLLFANAGGKPHSLSAEDGSFTTGIVAPGPEKGRFAGSNATITLDKSGTFKFFCDIHPQAMTGTVTVAGAQVAGGPAPASSGPRTATVAMADFEFREKQVSLAPGGEITFQNGGEAPHTATLDDVAAADTGRVDPGQSKTLVAPSAPGSYSYKCTLHPARMRGVIVVLGQSTPDPVAQAAATTVPPNSDDQGAAATTAPTVAPSGSGYTAAAGVSGGMQVWVIITLLVAAFLGGAGIASFLRRRST